MGFPVLVAQGSSVLCLVAFIRGRGGKRGVSEESSLHIGFCEMVLFIRSSQLKFVVCYVQEYKTSIFFMWLVVCALDGGTCASPG